MKNIILVILTLLVVGCKKDEKKEHNEIKQNHYVKVIEDSVEISVPKTWKIISDSTYHFAALMDKSDEKSEAILLSNSIKIITLRDYMIHDLSTAIELQQKEGLPYYVYKYYVENNNWCYILETFPKNKKGIFSFIREYNGNIYDLTFKTPEGQEQIPLKKDSLIEIIKTLKINNQYLFPKDSKAVVTDLTDL
ncbi:hypothetical protein ATE47_12415 [Chryseobacterium sp. IHB B 17019]|uniref:hypothetical protein n=1 Tax=Chryseobacterium sp. IHB B 17019 TaxID=1721091 RepID=UPI000722FEB2|nr:hypothetical protein [Chryseobacterium sp. IHB B 17019]ALR31276.1 hypothetical protein ATE47_12415 [Chryseobacterium sp. IHB B 17019]